MTPGGRLLRGPRRRHRPGRWSARRPTAPPRCWCAARASADDAAGRRAAAAPRRHRGHRDDRRGLVGLARRLAGRLPVAALPAALVGVRRPGRASPREFEAGRARRPGRPGRRRGRRPARARRAQGDGRRGAARDRGQRLRRRAAARGGVRPGRRHRSRGAERRPPRPRCSGCWCSPSSSRRPATLELAHGLA